MDEESKRQRSKLIAERESLMAEANCPRLPTPSPRMYSPMMANGIPNREEWLERGRRFDAQVSAILETVNNVSDSINNIRSLIISDQ